MTRRHNLKLPPLQKKKTLNLLSTSADVTRSRQWRRSRDFRIR